MLISYGHILKETCLFATLSGQNKTNFLIKTAENKSALQSLISTITKKILSLQNKEMEEIKNKLDKILITLDKLAKRLDDFEIALNMTN